MSSDLLLRCRCGHVRGIARDVSPSAGFRFLCYCKHCQAFARFLDRPDVLDAAGGTDIFQLPPSLLTFTAGIDALQCVHLSSKVLRWYAGCCRTPIGNTASDPRFPLVGLIHSFIDQDVNESTRDKCLGPPRCRIHESSAVGPLPRAAPASLSFGAFANRAAKLLSWWMRGLARPNPFFDARTNDPIAVPRIFAP